MLIFKEFRNPDLSRRNSYKIFRELSRKISKYLKNPLIKLKEAKK